MISLGALTALVWLAVIGGALVPVILLVLFVLDYNSKTIW